VPPQHKKAFASAFLKTKEQVLRTNGGIKRVDLLEVWRLVCPNPYPKPNPVVKAMQSTAAVAYGTSGKHPQPVVPGIYHQLSVRHMEKS